MRYIECLLFVRTFLAWQAFCKRFNNRKSILIFNHYYHLQHYMYIYKWYDHIVFVSLACVHEFDSIRFALPTKIFGRYPEAENTKNLIRYLLTLLTFIAYSSSKFVEWNEYRWSEFDMMRLLLWLFYYFMMASYWAFLTIVMAMTIPRKCAKKIIQWKCRVYDFFSIWYEWLRITLLHMRAFEYQKRSFQS